MESTRAHNLSSCRAPELQLAAAIYSGGLALRQMAYLTIRSSAVAGCAAQAVLQGQISIHESTHITMLGVLVEGTLVLAAAQAVHLNLAPGSRMTVSTASQPNGLELVAVDSAVELQLDGSGFDIQCLACPELAVQLPAGLNCSLELADGLVDCGSTGQLSLMQPPQSLTVSAAASELWVYAAPSSVCSLSVVADVLFVQPGTAGSMSNVNECPQFMHLHGKNRLEMAPLAVLNSAGLRLSSDGKLIVHSSAILNASVPSLIAATPAGVWMYAPSVRFAGTVLAASNWQLTHKNSRAGSRCETPAAIEIWGEEIHLDSGAVVNGSSEQFGRTVLIGGGFEGKCEENCPGLATQLLVDEDVHILSNGGDGGCVALWANVKTVFEGQIEARGSDSGNGGFVEVLACSAVCVLHVVMNRIVRMSTEIGPPNE